MHIDWFLLPLTWQSRSRGAAAKAAVRGGCQNQIQKNSSPAGQLFRHLSVQMVLSSLQKVVRTAFFGKANPWTTVVSNLVTSSADW
ncbi:hypothetical protein [Ruegeria profundi]|uniref:hypothetical protein n=1 Tax=Ruegeria profundi TaxID=1685378 RepID=UPI003C7EC563